MRKALSGATGSHGSRALRGLWLWRGLPAHIYVARIWFTTCNWCEKKWIETRSITTRQNLSAKWLSESPCTKDKCPGEMTQIDEGDAYVTGVSTALGAQQMVVFLSLVFPPQMERWAQKGFLKWRGFCWGLRGGMEISSILKFWENDHCSMLLLAYK